MKLLRKITFPFVPLYYLVTGLRNWCYDIGIFQSKSYDLPIICVGNLSVGGTGKTPMVEYLIRLLKEDHKVGTLSRGYKRKTHNFIIANEMATTQTIGDEPLQFYRKFKNIIVAVDTDRQNGIKELIQLDADAIILDDAFQHRKVKAGLNILLSTFEQPYFSDYVLPAGNLREARSCSQRADIIMITKCPEDLNDSAKSEIVKRIRPKKHQEVFFSRTEYGKIPQQILQKEKVTVVTGIANPGPFIDHLKGKGLKFEHLKFKDHHEFSSSEIAMLKEKELILTTEKDYMRLNEYIEDDALFYVPIETKIDRTSEFNSRVKSFVKNFKKR